VTESNGRVSAPAVAMVYQIYCFPALSDLFLSVIRRSVSVEMDSLQLVVISLV